MYKKNLVLFIVSCISIQLNAQRKSAIELKLPHQPSQYLNVRLYMDQYLLFGDQQYSATITNISNQTVEVTGTISGITYCGNSTSSDFDITLKPQETQGGQASLFDNTGLTGSVSTNGTGCKAKFIKKDPNGGLDWYSILKSTTINVSTKFIQKTPTANNNNAVNSDNDIGSNKNIDTLQNISSNSQSINNNNNNNDASKNYSSSQDGELQSIENMVDNSRSSDKIAYSNNLAQVKIKLTYYIQVHGNSPQTEDLMNRINNLQTQSEEQNAEDFGKSTAAVVQDLSKIKKREKNLFEADLPVYLVIGVDNPLNKYNAFQSEGFNAALLLSSLGDRAAFDLEASFAFNLPLNSSYYDSLFNTSKSISKINTRSDLGLFLHWGPILYKNETKNLALVLQATIGGLLMGSINLKSDNGNTYYFKELSDYGQLDNSVSSTLPFVWEYGGKLKFYTNSFTFSLGYITNFTLKSITPCLNGSAYAKSYKFDLSNLFFKIGIRI